MQEDETQKIPLQRALKWAPTWYSWPFTSRSLSQWVSRSVSCHDNAHNNSYGNGWCNAHKNHLEVVILIGQKYQNDIFTSQLKYSRLQHISGNLMSHDSFCDCYFDRYCDEADSVEQIPYAGAVGI